MIFAIAHRETKLQDTSASPTNDLDLLGLRKITKGRTNVWSRFKSWRDSVHPECCNSHTLLGLCPGV